MRRLGSIALALAVVALISAAVWRAADERMIPASVTISGRVRIEEHTVEVPLLRSDSPTMPVTPGQPIVAGQLASVDVAEGDRVSAGEVVATLGTIPLDAAVSAAQASAHETSASVALLDERAASASDSRSTLAAKRREVRDALAGLRRRRDEVAANLAGARALVSALTATPTTPTPAPGQPDPRTIVAQLEAALAQLDAGIAKADAGLAKLDEARATIDDAIVVLADTRVAAVAAADAAEAGVSLARARRDLATVRAPVDGVVIEAPRAGAVVYAGAPLVRIRPDGDTIVEAYVTTADEMLLGVGTHVLVSADYLPSPLGGIVSEISNADEYPPTSQATRDIHMIRGLRVRVRVPDGIDLPPGTPVDITVRTGR